MVVFQDGRPLKRDYRRFRIESCGHADDYAAMAEVLTRRFQRYLDGDERFALLPDLLLIDGGQTPRSGGGGRGHVPEPERAGAGHGEGRQAPHPCPDDRLRPGAGHPPVSRSVRPHRHGAGGVHASPSPTTTSSTKAPSAPSWTTSPAWARRGRSCSRPSGTVSAVKSATVEQLCRAVPRPAAQAVYDHFHGREKRELLRHTGRKLQGRRHHRRPAPGGHLLLPPEPVPRQFAGQGRLARRSAPCGSGTPACPPVCSSTCAARSCGRGRPSPAAALPLGDTLPLSALALPEAIAAALLPGQELRVDDSGAVLTLQAGRPVPRDPSGRVGPRKVWPCRASTCTCRR